MRKDNRDGFSIFPVPEVQGASKVQQGKELCPAIAMKLCSERTQLLAIGAMGFRIVEKVELRKDCLLFFQL